MYLQLSYVIAVQVQHSDKAWRSVILHWTTDEGSATDNMLLKHVLLIDAILNGSLLHSKSMQLYKLAVLDFFWKVCTPPQTCCIYFEDGLTSVTFLWYATVFTREHFRHILNTRGVCF